MNLQPRHPYLHARVALLAGCLLPIESLEAFAHSMPEEGMSNTIQNRSNASGADSLQQVLKHDITEYEQVFSTLTQGFMDDFMVLLRPLNGSERAFLIYWLRKYEIANLKAIMRGKMAGLTAEQIRRQGLRDISPFNSLPLNDLLTTEDTAEMLRQLANSPYAETAEQARQVHEKQKTFYVVEATIAHRYLSGLLRRARGINDSNERAPLLFIVRLLLERFNLIWALRYRFTYQLSPAETYYLLIAGAGSHLTGQDLSDLVKAHSIEAMLENLPAELQEQLEDVHGITGIEQIIEEYVRVQARKLLNRSQSALARTFAYLILRECEVQRLAAIVKGRQMQLPTHIILDGVALSDAGAGLVI